MNLFIVKRLAGLVPVLVALSVVVFILIHLIPGDPALVMLGSEATPDKVAALRQTLDLDRPIHIQFLTWFTRIVQGDMGKSILRQEPVARLVAERLPTTLALAAYALLITLLVALPTGVVAAIRRGSHVDYLVMAGSMLGLSIPSFFLGLLLIVVFSLKLGWFPSTGYVAISEDFVEGLRYLTLPGFSLGLIQAAIVSRMVRSSMLETLRQDYVRTARAKGLRERTVIYRHALRNALIPVVTVIGINLGVLLGGTVVVETVFAVPGVGRLVVNSITSRDYPVIQGVMLYVTASYVLINLATDALYVYLDPRVHYA